MYLGNVPDHSLVCHGLNMILFRPLVNICNIITLFISNGEYSKTRAVVAGLVLNLVPPIFPRRNSRSHASRNPQGRSLSILRNISTRDLADLD